MRSVNGSRTAEVTTLSELVLRANLAPLKLGVSEAGMVITFDDITGERNARTDLTEREAFARSILESLAMPTAVVDRPGVIQLTNRAWREVTLASRDRQTVAGTGANSLEVCQRSVATGCTEVIGARDALTAVLNGEAAERSLDYGLATDPPTCWELRVTPRHWAAGGAVLTHTDNAARHHAQDALWELVRSDPLTGLLNRAGFHDAVERVRARAARAQTALTLLYLDLDDFKPVNDTHGHEAGDEVLRTVAQRLVSQVRASDLVSRLGDDEFAVLCDDLDDHHRGILVQRITEAIEEPIPIGNHQIRISASIGVSTHDATADLDLLLRTADEQMYRHKRSGPPAGSEPEQPRTFQSRSR